MMSRTKWYFRPNRAYAMGICLHHRRPILYDEGRAKGCVSRRRCKWFRGPNEGTPAEVMEATSCPAEEEWEYEEPEEEEDPDEDMREKMYECQSCGFRFEEPEPHRERCEGYGYEEVWGCPRCGGGYIEVYV